MSNVSDADDDALPAGEDIEARARRMGWRPESEWDDSRGGKRPPKFLTAEEYLDKVENDIPVLRERLRHTDAEREEFRGEVHELRQRLGETAELVKSLHDAAKETGQRAYERAYRELYQRQREAVAEADTEKFDRAQAEMNALIEDQNKRAAQRAKAPPPPPAATPTGPQIEPATRAWVAENTWFQTDPVLHAMAIEAEAEIRRSAPGMPTSEVLAEVKQRAVERFPEKFGVNPRRRASSVASPSAPERRRNGKSMADLPEEHRAIFRSLQKQFKDRGIDYKEDEYLADYQWD